MTIRHLRLVLGDQLSFENPVLQEGDPEHDLVLMAEVVEETRYVRHNRHKLVLVLSAMRHFARELESAGWRVRYMDLGSQCPSLFDALVRTVEDTQPEAVCCTEPGEYRLRRAMADWTRALDVPFELLGDTRFLASHDDFRQWAAGRKQLRMEYFYRDMRQRYGLLLDGDGGPEGGRWNYDRENRAGWRGEDVPPPREGTSPDALTRAVIREVDERFADCPGDLSEFAWAVTREDAEAELEAFCRRRLSRFGHYQDALADGEPWLFHSRLSAYLNIGLLEPLAVCRRVESAWRAGDCELAAAEGFIRQILGWREYVRGIYWLEMPGYRERNALSAHRPLPAWFWTGDTDMRCLSQALEQSLSLGYAHHIQRLMVIGNFALLAGLSVEAVCEWYLGVYVDAFEWVELPNTLGMALHADNGLMASKPYAASGKYVQRQGDHCRHCRYDPRRVTGEDACPYNALYWHFIDRHRQRFSGNPRMKLVLANWRRKPAAERRAITDWGEVLLSRLEAE
jgi:deoxyribodipyrimidine photolyase-related protein